MVIKTLFRRLTCNFGPVTHACLKAYIATILGPYLCTRTVHYIDLYCGTTIVAQLVLLTATSNMIPFLPIHFRLVESPTDIALQDGVDILLVRGATLFADAVEVGRCVGFEVVGSAVGDEDMGLTLVG